MAHEKIIAERIKDLMDERGLNQRALEQAIGISNQAISFWLAGKRKPGAEAIIALARYFQCSADYILGLQDSY